MAVVPFCLFVRKRSAQNWLFANRSCVFTFVITGMAVPQWIIIELGVDLYPVSPLITEPMRVLDEIEVTKNFFFYSYIVKYKETCNI